MAKRCTVCNKIFPDELNYCPQCGAWAESSAKPRGKTNPDRRSGGGDPLVDPMKPDPPSGVGKGGPPEIVDEDIIEIDWEEIGTPEPPAPGTVPSVLPPAGEAPPPAPPPIMAGWRAVGPPKPQDPANPPPPRTTPRSSSAEFELGEAPLSNDDELLHVEPEADIPRIGADEVNIGHAPVEDGGSEVRLTPDAPGMDRLAWEEEELSARADEPSAVNLAELVPGEQLGSGEGLEAETLRRRDVRPPVTAKPSRAGGWVAGGIAGAALATAAGLALWMGGVEPPAAWRLAGTTPTGGPPPVQAPGATVEPLPMPADSTAQVTIDQLRKENESLSAEKKKSEDNLAAVHKLLADAKYITPEQGDMEAGVSALLKDLATAKQAKLDDGPIRAEVDRLKKENQTLAEDKKKVEGNLAAIHRLLSESKYITDEQPSVEKGIANVLQDLASAKQPKPEDGGMRAELDRLKKENDANTEGRKKSEAQLAAMAAMLKESHYVTDQQPDVAKGLDALIKDQKKSGDAPAVLAAVSNALRAAKYLTAEQPNVAKGIEQLVADKQTAEKNLAETTAKLAAIGTTEKDVAARLNAAENTIKDLTARVKTADDAIQDMTAKVRNSDAAARETAAKLKTANDTLRDVAVKLAAARVVGPDARGPALVRGVEELVASATAAPKDSGPIRNAASLSRPPEPTTPSDPLGAERHYVRGLSNFWAGRYWAAESDFFDAVRDAGSSSQDARYYYFLGLAQLAQGKNDEAREMLRLAGILEKDRRPSSAVVSRALERVQGNLRRVLEDYRP
jgi:hypothetical protein